jgi:acetyl esterase/lipase
LPAPPVFTEHDYAELRRIKHWLNRLPRIRMQTVVGRAIAHWIVLVLELALIPSVRRSGVRIETRSVLSLGKRLKLRILRPEGKIRGVHLDIHGGGWCAGNARMDDKPNAALAMRHGIAVVGFEYASAPKHSVREIISWCDAAALWLAENARREFGTDRFTIGGESAGAHLALCTLLKRRSLFRGALLYYGPYDLSGSDGLRNAPRDTLIFHAPTMLPCLQLLTKGMTDEERRAPDISPAFADLSGLPPVLLICGTDDPLLMESENLRAWWQKSNDNAEILLVPHAPHAFNRLPISIARKTEEFAHAWLSERFSAQSQ